MRNFTKDFLQTYKCAFDILPKRVSVTCSVKKVFWSTLLSENLRGSGSTTWVEKKGCLVESGGTPARLSVKNMSLCLKYWGILDFKHRSPFQSSAYWQRFTYFPGILTFPFYAVLSLAKWRTGMYSIAWKIEVIRWILQLNILRSGPALALFLLPDHLNYLESELVFISDKITLERK